MHVLEKIGTKIRCVFLLLLLAAVKKVVSGVVTIHTRCIYLSILLFDDDDGSVFCDVLLLQCRWPLLLV